MRSATQTQDSNVCIAKKVPDRRNYFFNRAFLPRHKRNTGRYEHVSIGPRFAGQLGAPQVPHSGRAVISRKLRELYDAVQEEGIPDKFLDLLEKLDEAESKANMKASEE